MSIEPVSSVHYTGLRALHAIGIHGRVGDLPMSTGWRSATLDCPTRSVDWARLTMRSVSAMNGQLAAFNLALITTGHVKLAPAMPVVAAACTV